MTRLWRYLAAGVVVYLLVLVGTFPAERITTRIEQQVEDLSLLSVSGSVFSGQAGQLVYQDLDLGIVRWQFRPWALLLGKLEYKVVLVQPDNSGQAIIGVTLAGNAYGRDLEMRLIPDRIINHYSPVLVQTSGVIQLAIERFDVGADSLQDVAGLIDWQDALIIEPFDLLLGQVSLSLHSEENGLAGTFEDGGVLGIAGDVVLLPAGKYNISMVLNPGSDADAATLDLLEHAAQLQPDGSYTINTSGQL
ncbi:MAG: type II secretion system protein GspN [Gammaproteobacteria bacterium]|jgi:hypothetical protein|nr:type II secretion system protein GspN [Gammaproteobacteria bacterium]